MPERNRVQAQLPRGAIVIPKPHGTAPGIQMNIGMPTARNVALFALPGVPAEMKEMWQQTIIPTLRSMLGSPRVIRHQVIKCFGVGESDLEQRLPDIIRRGRIPTVGITVSEATISLRITAEGSDETECRQLMEPTCQIIHRSLGALVFAEGEDELQHAVLRLLRRQNQSLAVCEWGTRGLVARWLAEVEPAVPGVYRGALVVCDSGALEALGDELRSAQQPADMTRLVAAMADHSRRTLQASLGLAIGPWPATDGPGERDRLFFAIAAENETRARSAITAGHPEILRPRAAKQALDFLRYWLLEKGGDSDQPAVADSR
jgi:nicotinamide-nucleotide amidase